MNVTPGYSFGATEQVTAEKLTAAMSGMQLTGIVVEDLGTHFTNASTTTAAPRKIGIDSKSLAAGNHVHGVAGYKQLTNSSFQRNTIHFLKLAAPLDIARGATGFGSSLPDSNTHTSILGSLSLPITGDMSGGSDTWYLVYDGTAWGWKLLG